MVTVVFNVTVVRVYSQFFVVFCDVWYWKCTMSRIQGIRHQLSTEAKYDLYTSRRSAVVGTAWLLSYFVPHDLFPRGLIAVGRSIINFHVMFHFMWPRTLYALVPMNMSIVDIQEDPNMNKWNNTMDSFIVPYFQCQSSHKLCA